MKQLSIFLVIGLLLALSTSSVAAANNNFLVGLDYAFNAKIDSNKPSSNEKIDCTGYRLTGEYLADKYKLGASLGTLLLTDADKSEKFNEIYGGYRIVNNVFADLTYSQHT